MGGSRVWGPGLLTGVGLGGFVDGIVLHQLLQWHHLLSARGDPLPAQVVADGVFHVGTFLAVLVGLLWLWRRTSQSRGTGPRSRRRPPWSALLGPLLAGWGAFNLVEGLVNHHLLELHHVRPGPFELWYDLGFLLSGGLLLAAGVLLHRHASSRHASPRRPVSRW